MASTTSTKSPIKSATKSSTNSPATPNLPNLSEAGAYYWQSGQDGNFSLAWCSHCLHWLHPSREICCECFNPTVAKIASGRATLASFTVNHQAWQKGQQVPYTIGIICPIEDPNIQITTKLMAVSTNKFVIGMPVDVVFEQADNVWLPCFKPTNGKHLTPQKHRQKTTEPTLTGNVAHKASKCWAKPRQKYESACAFTGIGKSHIGRHLPQSPLALSTKACINAVNDANITMADIDGVCAYPGTTGLPGLSSGGVRDISHALNLTPTWHMGAQEIPGQAGAISAAMLAIAAGLCKNVLCFTHFATSARPHAKNQHNGISGEPRWSLPFGCVSPANWIAMYANRYMAQFNANEQLLGTLAIATRKNAQRNSEALYTDPLDMSTYLHSRRISTPFKLLDCDTPCDGAIAFVLSHVDNAKDQTDKPIYIESFGSAIAEVQSWDQGTLVYQPNVQSASRHLWSRSQYTPKDVDIAQLYDGFSFNAICWLEALGFCEAGGATAFIGDGSILDINGALPLNTHGGHLNAGRSNGYGHLYEAIEQLRGNAGKRQVNGATVAAVSSGGGIPASAMLLSATAG